VIRADTSHHIGYASFVFDFDLAQRAPPFPHATCPLASSSDSADKVAMPSEFYSRKERRRWLGWMG